MATRESFIITSLRTAVGKAKKGSLRRMRPEQMGATVVREAVKRTGKLERKDVDDVLIGCAFPEGPQGMNMGRIIAGEAGLPVTVPGATVNRFCASGLQTIAMACQSIASNCTDVVVAGGAESMSMVPMSGFYFQPDPEIAQSYPDAYIGMGLTAENVAEKYQISRQEQDRFSQQSHDRALRAQAMGHFNDEIIPLEVTESYFNGSGIESKTTTYAQDEGPREDSSLEALARLKPVFKRDGTVTAGNSSQTSDGAAATVVMSKEVMFLLDLEPMARMVQYAVHGVSPEIMGIGPVGAIRKVLRRSGLTLDQIELIELNEAFASQALAVIQQARLDEELVNVNGGAIALGHPLGCTGAKLTATLLHEMKRRRVRYGMCTMCVGGGMGAAAIFENLQL